MQTIDRENNFWFIHGHEGIMAPRMDEGIAVFNGSDWEFYTTYNSNFPSNTVHQIAVDPDGTTWLATAKGLVAFNKNE